MGPWPVTRFSDRPLITSTEATDMLVLSRKQDQRISLGDGIVVTVLRVGRDRVRLGIDAPPEVHVLRGELELKPEVSAAH
jgi:carbon storage regulator